MEMIFKILPIFSLLLLVGVANAAEKEMDGGSIAGNGGDVVFCEGVPSRPAIQLLDFYELELFENARPLKLESTPGTAMEKAAAANSQMSEISPLRTARYLDELAQFMSRITFVQDELPNLPDDLNIVLPNGCTLRQIAIQQKPQGHPQYTINEALWNGLDENQKAGLFLHEIVYSENIDGGHKDARATRALTKRLAYGLPGKDQHFGNSDFVRMLRKMGIYTYLEDILDSGDELLGAGRNICGFKKKNGPLVNFPRLCSASEPALDIVKDFRIKKVTHPDGTILYKMPGAEIGLPETYDSFDAYSNFAVQSFVDAAPFTLSNSEDQVTCLPGKNIYLERNDKEGSRAVFDLANSRLWSCELDQSQENRLLLQGKWRDILSIAGNQHSDSSIAFKGPQEFEHRGNRFTAKNYRIEDYVLRPQREIFSEVPPFLYTAKSFSCTASGQVSTNPTELSFTAPCAVELKGGKPFLKSIVLDEKTQGFKGGVLAAQSVFSIYGVSHLLPEGTPLDVDYFQGDIRVADREAVVNTPAKVEIGDGQGTLSVIGAFKLYNTGFLDWGTLAKTQTLEMVGGSYDRFGCYKTGPGYFKGKRTVKAGTKIQYVLECKAFEIFKEKN